MKSSKKILTANSRGFFAIIDFSDINVDKPLTYVKLHDSPVIKIVAKNELGGFFSCDKTEIKFSTIFNNEMKEKAKTILNGVEPVRDLASNGLKLASGHEDKSIKLWDLTRFTKSHSFEAHGSDVTSVDWHPTKAILASGAKDRLLRLWDVHNNKNICTLFNHTNTVNTISFHPDCDLFASAGKDQIVRVFDTRMFKELYQLKSHDAEIYSLHWNPDNCGSLVSADITGKICLWTLPYRLPTDIQMHSTGMYVSCCKFDMRSELMVSTSSDKTIKLWEVTSIN